MQSDSGPHPFSRQWLPIGLGQIVALSCGLAGVHLATRWVQPADLGVYGLFLSLVPLSGMLTHAGLIKHFSRHWSSAPDKAAYLRQWLGGARLPAVLLVGAGVAIGAMNILNPVGLLGAAILVVAGLAGTFAQAFQLGVQSTGRFWTDLGLTSAHSSTRTFLPLLGVAITGGGIVALLSGYLLHALLVALLGLAVVLGLGRRLPVKTVAAESTSDSLSRYTWLFLVNGVLALINQGIVRWCAGLAFDHHTLGFITMAGNLAAVGPSMLAGALWQYHYPKLLAAHHQADDRTVRRLTDRALIWMLTGCLVGGVLLAVLLPFLPGSLVATAYVDAIQYIMPLFAFYVGLCSLTLIQGESLVLDRPALAVRVTLAGSVLLSGGTIAMTALAPEHLNTWFWWSPLPTLVAARLMLRRSSSSTMRDAAS